VQIISTGESEYHVEQGLFVNMQSTFVIVVGRVNIMHIGVCVRERVQIVPVGESEFKSCLLGNMRFTFVIVIGRVS